MCDWVFFGSSENEWFLIASCLFSKWRILFLSESLFFGWRWKVSSFLLTWSSRPSRFVFFDWALFFSSFVAPDWFRFLTATDSVFLFSLTATGAAATSFAKSALFLFDMLNPIGRWCFLLFYSAFSFSCFSHFILSCFALFYPFTLSSFPPFSFVPFFSSAGRAAFFSCLCFHIALFSTENSIIGLRVLPNKPAECSSFLSLERTILTCF